AGGDFRMGTVIQSVVGVDICNLFVYGRAMTALLEKAIEKASALPEKEQEVIGALILEEIADIHRHSRSITFSPGNSGQRHFVAGRGLCPPENPGRGRPLPDAHGVALLAESAAGKLVRAGMV
ncbi:MAG: hypothetical protein ACLPRE_11430, partial [Limisphaerales bacterium]